MPKKIKKKVKSISKLKKEVWTIFSKWIRNRDDYTCYTCHKKDQNRGLYMHAGHFVSRSHNATLFDEMNVHAQCYYCNIRARGNIGLYAERLIRDYGQEAFNELLKRGRTIKSFQPSELEELKIKYSQS